MIGSNASFAACNDFGKFLQGAFIDQQHGSDNTSDVTANNKVTTQEAEQGIPMSPENLPLIVQKIDNYITRLQKMKAELISLSSKIQSGSPKLCDSAAVVSPASSVSDETNDGNSISSCLDNNPNAGKELRLGEDPNPAVANTTISRRPSIAFAAKMPPPEAKPAKKRKRSIDETSNDGSCSESEEGADPYILNRR